VSSSSRKCLRRVLAAMPATGAMSVSGFRNQPWLPPSGAEIEWAETRVATELRRVLIVGHRHSIENPRALYL
jgi:hypothetical protein